MNGLRDVWYVAYGSNMNSARFGKYLQTLDEPLREVEAMRTIDVDNDVYFAGRSRTWNGPVAFMSLVRGSSSRCLARRLAWSALEAVARQENGSSAVALLDVELPEIGTWSPLAVTRTGTKGKYDALLRLQDIEGTPAVTLTTSREMVLGTPTEAYRSVIEEGLGHSIPVPVFRSGETNQRYLGPQARYRFETTTGTTTGFQLVEAPTTPGEKSDLLTVASASVHDQSRRVWVRFASDARSDRVQISDDVASTLLLDRTGDTRIQIDFTRPRTFDQLPGRPGDIPESDVVFLSDDDASAIGPWALLVSERFAAPVRVLPRDHVPSGSVRAAYALRNMASLAQGAPIRLQTLDGDVSGTRNWLRRKVRTVSEALVGAPPVALRSTEGLVGDDGRAILRVDGTALDFLGCGSGDEVAVTWARRSARATVLLHTPVTRRRMDRQLSDSTGHQSRAETGDVATRLNTPPHLQAWLSSTLRSKLDIPPDSIVRVRRSTRYIIQKNSVSLALPVAALILAALAIPNCWLWALVGIPVVSAIALLPIRRPHVRSARSRRRPDR